jgi:molecular chaperone HtpG
MTAQVMEFKTEVNQILDLMIHSLYSHKEIFLRELISNASDALDKARYEALINSDLMTAKGDWKIKITADKAAGTLTISDNGIGMDKDEAITALGTIAHSGTKEFLQSLKSKDIQDNPELIGQFGVGFYSAFMVADRITVLTRKAGNNIAGVKWESAADGSFTIEEITKEHPGTDVILSVKEEEKKYLDEWEIRSIVKKYSDYIEYPVVMEVEREKESTIEKGARVKIREEETINSGRALWLKDRTEIAEAEYNEFYHHISHDFADPSKVIHYKAEGTSEFISLLYIPSKAPLDIFYKEYKIGPALYVKRVQIMDHCEQLIPQYLRFVKGLVDSSDLPLNVSREMLQSNRQTEIIRNNITKKILESLGEMKTNEYEKYLVFSNEFGRILKEGLHYDYSRRETIADLLLFHSTKADKGTFRTLQEYVSSMKADQEDIYYLTGTSREELLKSPHLEMFVAKDYEVLIMLDEIDDLIFSNFEYKGKKFKSIVKGEISIDKKDEGREKEAREKFDNLLHFIKETLKDEVKDVRISGRLKDSPCCLVGDEGDMDPRMEKLLKSMGQDIPERKKILEINPAHPIFDTMLRIFNKDKGDSILKEYASLILDQALLLEGSKPKDPVLFIKYLSSLMLEHAKDEHPVSLSHHAEG